jgi:multidrug efflux pump subunit AcrB
LKRAIRWFAENPVAANLLMFLILVAGIASIGRINQKTFPDIQVDMISIAVPYLGAAPEEVEEGVCVRIEEEVHGIQGVDRITSNAAEGMCSVAVELVPNYSVDRALSEVKNAVDGISTFPEQTEKPIVSHVEVERNALKLALSGAADERALRLWAEQIRDEIASLPGVTQVALVGARDYEISIEVPEESLRRHGLTFDQVARAVQRSSVDLPGGSIRTSGGEILLRAKGQAYIGSEFERIVVMTREDGTRLLLSDIATVVDGFEQDERRAVFDAESAVLIQVYRVGDQRVLDLTATVLAYVENARLRLPEGLSLTVWQNDAIYLQDRLGILLENGAMGFAMVMILLAVFLRLRLAFWVAIGVPVSMLGALWGFPIVGLSIDVLSLFAFILVLGLLVDDAIVIGENVHTHQERAEDPLEAAIVGTQEVAVPVIFGILTTVAAFLPMILAEGMMGDFFGTIGMVVVVCLFFSLIESQFVLPAHLGHHAMSAPSEKRVREPSPIQVRWKALQATMAGSLTRLAREGYRPVLERALEWRYSVLAGAIALLAITMSTLGAGYIKFSFFPQIESDFISATVVMPAGTPVEVTEEAVAQLEAAAIRTKAGLDAEHEAIGGGSLVKHMLATVGELPTAGPSGPPGTGGSSAGPNQGGVAIELVGGDYRRVTGAEVVEQWRAQAPAIPGAEEVTFTSSYMNAGEPIYIQLSSPDLASLQAAAEELKGNLASYPGVHDIKDSWADGKEELQLSIRPDAELLGLTLDDLARQVRQAFYGAEAQRIQRGRDDIRVMVRYPESRRRSLDDLEELRIRTPDGTEVPFYAVANAERGRGYSTIRRADRKRVIGVIADVDAERANANEIIAALVEGQLPALQERYPGLVYTLEGEQSEQQETATSVAQNFGLAMFLIYVLLAIPLKSYGQPLIIMAVIPFGLVGAIAGHLLLGMDFSMLSVFGVVALAGVVVNSSLVLVHYINTRREQGVDLRTAVQEAGVMRFRPIVLTSITTFVGLSPLLFERSMGAQFLIPMAASLGFGVIFATVISLFMVPCGYVVLDDIAGLFRRSRRPGAPGHLESIPFPKAGR